MKVWVVYRPGYFKDCKVVIGIFLEESVAVYKRDQHYDAWVESLDI